MGGTSSGRCHDAAGRRARCGRILPPSSSHSAPVRSGTPCFSTVRQFCKRRGLAGRDLRFCSFPVGAPLVRGRDVLAFRLRARSGTLYRRSVFIALYAVLLLAPTLVLPPGGSGSGRRGWFPGIAFRNLRCLRYDLSRVELLLRIQAKWVALVLAAFHVAIAGLSRLDRHGRALDQYRRSLFLH